MLCPSPQLQGPAFHCSLRAGEEDEDEDDEKAEYRKMVQEGIEGKRDFPRVNLHKEGEEPAAQVGARHSPGIGSWQTSRGDVEHCRWGVTRSQAWEKTSIGGEKHLDACELAACAARAAMLYRQSHALAGFSFESIASSPS